ncbi:MAG: diaminopimelate epimerase [bacterium]|nr:diaminopimelate epimerase [bacterium]
MEFLKAEGLGNDFVMVQGAEPTAEQIRRWCDRRTGIGADGVLRVSRPDHREAVARMQYWNADGTPAGMCGNGLRCVARYVFDGGWSKERLFTIQTPTGMRQVEILDDGMIRVELGPYRVGSGLRIRGRSFTTADVGNPHAVTFVEEGSELETVPLRSVGLALQGHQSFPEGVNVEFAAGTAHGFRVRVWERGAGETRACGTGAAAVAAVAFQRGCVGSATEIELPGGPLAVELIEGVAWITGPAVLVFSGTIPDRTGNGETRASEAR